MMIIRSATLADLPSINSIYNYYVEHSTCTYQIEPSTEQERLAWFSNRKAIHPAIVAEESGQVIGWAAISTWNARCGYNTTVESSVYIHKDHHRKGLGKKLMDAIISQAKKFGHHTIIAGISADQEPSVRLHEQLGFEKISHFREVGVKFGKRLDVVHMQLMLKEVS